MKRQNSGLKKLVGMLNHTQCNLDEDLKLASKLPKCRISFYLMAFGMVLWLSIDLQQTSQY
ncbi:hypothetical protein BDQ17DRAFT_1437283 [Cyathus striatus]|nr:hypothetical protein BDQ17DRAFT_1437283 [Cyathus striatus]